MKLVISKDTAGFVVDNPEAPGSPPIGRGKTMLEAIGSYVHQNQDRMSITFEVDETAQPAETRRRQRELARR